MPIYEVVEFGNTIKVKDLGNLEVVLSFIKHMKRTLSHLGFLWIYMSCCDSARYRLVLGVQHMRFTYVWVHINSSIALFTWFLASIS